MLSVRLVSLACLSAIALLSFTDGVPVGQIITSCSVPNALAITFDDGPGQTTASVLDALDRHGIKATFFVNGDNVAHLNQPADAAMLRRIYNSGHQVASHTYRHYDLNTLSAAGIREEMELNDQAIKNAIGVRPTYMRPPFGNANGNVQSQLGQLGYHVVNWNLDTNDWRHPTDTAASVATYRQTLNEAAHTGSFIVLQHDVVPGTNGQLVDEVVAMARAKGMRLLRVDECLGAPGSAYRS